MEVLKIGENKIKRMKITLSLSDDIEKQLRAAAKEPPFHDKKGSISMIVEDALIDYFRDKKT